MLKKYVILFVTFCTFVSAQSHLELIKKDALLNSKSNNLLVSDVNDLIIADEFTNADNNLKIYHVRQAFKGIEILNSDSNFLISNNKVLNKGGDNFISNLADKVNSHIPDYDAVAALKLVFQSLKEKNIEKIAIAHIMDKRNKYKLSNGDLIDYPVNAQLIYFQDANKNLRLSWSFEFYSQDLNHLWDIKLDAITGKIIYQKDLVISCQFENHNHTNDCQKNIMNGFFKRKNNSIPALTPGTTNYRVIKWNFESPNHTNRTLETNPEFTANASPNGWHNANTGIGGTTSTLTYNYTRGNNVFAYSDFNNTNPVNPTTYTIASSGSYPSLTFDYPYGGVNVPSVDYIDAATTNLFYMNNIMHDVWYQYGFNEANKNFQAANYGRGGLGNDAVNAQSQDSSQLASPSLNNANFITPSDGSKPQMQMYLWNVNRTTFLRVNTGSLTGSVYYINDNAFTNGHVDLPTSTNPLTANIVLFDDGVAPESDACSPATPQNAALLNGKIAVIRRGTCLFVEKAMAAQNAGAIGVIIVNNIAGSVQMAGDNASITIPVISLSQADGETLIASIDGNVSVSEAVSKVR